MKKKILSLLGSEERNTAVCLQTLPDGPVIDYSGSRVYRAASTIKLVVLGELFRRFASGEADPDERVTIAETDHTGGDGIIRDLDGGHRFSLRELAALMVILSDNTAANILIERLGMDGINKYAADIGMTATVLRRKMMDSEAVRAGRENSTTALDLLLFFRELYREELPMSREMRAILERQQVTGRFERYLPEGTLIAHKTGDLEGLEHDAGIIATPMADIALVVLIDNAASNFEARERIARIARLVYEAYRE